MATRADITPELCRQLLRYEPETGKLFWLPRGPEMFPGNAHGGAEASSKTWNNSRAGQEAFPIGKAGYRKGEICNFDFMAHRVCWAIYHGKWPDLHIDHINGNRSDNRIANLRQVTIPENGRNMRVPKNNASGTIGVFWSERYSVWRASISVAGKKRWLGTFRDKEAAIAARKEAEVRYGYHENHGNHARRPLAE